MTEEGSIRPANSYKMTLGKDATDYLAEFTERVGLKGSWQKNPELKECYKWCEENMGVKYKDWFWLNHSIYFKNNKKATFFRLKWMDIIA
jgi:hypothetical protein